MMTKVRKTRSFEPGRLGEGEGGLGRGEWVLSDLEDAGGVGMEKAGA
jgi:hypothetical protein